MSSLSFALFGARLTTAEGEILEVSAADYSVTGFTFRLPPEEAEQLSRLPQKTECLFFGSRETERVVLTDYSIEREETAKHYTLFRPETRDTEFRKRMRALTEDMTVYTRLKNEEEGAKLSRYYCGYPPEAKKDLPSSFEAWRRKTLSGLETDESWRNEMCRVPEWSLAVYARPSRALFRKKGIEACLKTQLTACGLELHPIAGRVSDSICLMIISH